MTYTSKDKEGLRIWFASVILVDLNKYVLRFSFRVLQTFM